MARVFAAMLHGVEQLITSLNDLGASGTSTGTMLQQGLGTAFRVLTSGVVAFAGVLTLAADGWLALYNAIVGGKEAAQQSVDTINQHFKTFMQTLQDINTVDPSVPLVKLNTQWVQAKGGVADVTKGLKLFTTEATDGAKTRQKALDDEVQANTKYAADMIARYATLEEAQEQANDRRLDEEHDMMTKFRAIRDAGWAGSWPMKRKPGKRRKTWPRRSLSRRLPGSIPNERPRKKRPRTSSASRSKSSDKVGDVLFDFTKSLTDGSTKLKDIWKETLTTIKDLFLRTLTEMAARALV